jgi:hypothetical protein
MTRQSISYTAKKQYRKFETNTPRKGIARSQSQFPHLCVCERFINSQNRSAFSAAENTILGIQYINRPQTHENVETGTEAGQCPEKEHINGIFIAV